MNMHNLVKLNISVVSSCSNTVSHATEITCSFCATRICFLCSYFCLNCWTVKSRTEASLNSIKQMCSTEFQRRQMNSIEAWTHKLLEQPVLTRCRIEVDYTLCCSFTDKCNKKKQNKKRLQSMQRCLVIRVYLDSKFFPPKTSHRDVWTHAQSTK